MKNWLENDSYSNESFEYDNKVYNIKYKINSLKSIDIPKILIVSYQPNKNAAELTRLCIECIKKFTGDLQETWVIDDNSPIENLEWMDKIDDINLAFIRTEPKERGSYSNGIAMEVGVKLIVPDSKYVVTFHSDTVVCKNGWLQFLKSKINENVKAAGFRLTKERVLEGVLHVCGYMIDLQLYKKLNLSFMPDLPSYDIGDKLIHEFLKSGYNIFAAENTFDNNDSVDFISKTLAISKINVTRAFDDEKDVVYMHLGRGVTKARNKYQQEGKCNFEEWSEYIRKYLLSEPFYSIPDIKSFILNQEILNNYSLRDFYLHNFLKNTIDDFNPGMEIISLNDNNSYIYNNINKGLKINYKSLIDIDSINNPLDCIISLEDFYKISDIDAFILKTYDKLKKGGVFLISIPIILINDYSIFIKKILNNLWQTGYREVSIEKQGNELSLNKYIDFQKILKEYSKSSNERLLKIKEKFVRDYFIKTRNSPKLSDFKKYSSIDTLTTGYGIKAVK